MIKIRPDLLYVRDETGSFVPFVAIKGAPGDIANLGSFSTSEEGYSDSLVMTQKGVTTLMDGLREGDITVDDATHAHKDAYGRNIAESIDTISETANKAVADAYRLEHDLSNGNFVVDHANRSNHAYRADDADRTDYALEAGLADKATNDGNGNNIANTYAPLSQVNGTGIRKKILEYALSLAGKGKQMVVNHSIYLDNADKATDFELPADEMTRYGYVTIIVRSQKVVVWLWGGEGSNVWYNQYGNGWKGWRKLIDSNNIGSQSVDHAKTADSATTADSANLAKLANEAQFAESAHEADSAKTATTATKATQDGNGNNIANTYGKKWSLAKTVTISNGKATILREDQLADGLYCVTLSNITNKRTYASVFYNLKGTTRNIITGYDLDVIMTQASDETISITSYERGGNETKYAGTLKFYKIADI